MRRLKAAHWVLTAVLLFSWAVVGVLYATNNLEVRWIQEASVPEGLEGSAGPFYHERYARLRANEDYPEWLRGVTPGGWADERSRYHYTRLVGPKEAGLRAYGLLMGTLVLKPETTYPAHSHPAAEI